jgi:hypothetical protein
MYVLPSASRMRAPLARSMNTGVAPTDLNARTGLFTPPGRIRDDATKSFSDVR